MRSPIARSATLLLVAVLAVACADSPEDKAMRIASEQASGHGAQALERAQAKSLYEAARKYLVSGNPVQALKLYQEVQARFPFTDYATQAELESITAQYQSYDYDAAVAAADRFIKQHPRHPSVDYVYYLRGLVNYERVGSGSSLIGGDQLQRDPTHLRQAFTDFNLLIQNFPNSVYDKDAQLRMIEIKHRLAANELSIAEYYMRRRAWVAASRRAEDIIKRYQGSDSVPRALEIMEQSYRVLGLEELAQDTHTILQTSYPNYILHREEFYRQRAGMDPRYRLPPLSGPPAATAAQAEKEKKEAEAESAGQVSLREETP